MAQCGGFVDEDDENLDGVLLNLVVGEVEVFDDGGEVVAHLLEDGREVYGARCEVQLSYLSCARQEVKHAHTYTQTLTPARAHPFHSHTHSHTPSLF